MRWSEISQKILLYFKIWKVDHSLHYILICTKFNRQNFRNLVSFYHRFDHTKEIDEYGDRDASEILTSAPNQFASTFKWKQISVQYSVWIQIFKSKSSVVKNDVFQLSPRLWPIPSRYFQRWISHNMVNGRNFGNEYLLSDSFFIFVVDESLIEQWIYFNNDIELASPKQRDILTSSGNYHLEILRR